MYQILKETDVNSIVMEDQILGQEGVGPNPISIFY